MSSNDQSAIPARRGKSTHLPRGGNILVIDILGAQAADTWAFNVADLSEFTFMKHWRPTCRRYIPEIGVH